MTRVTERGFAITEIPFTDYRGSTPRIFQVQESSLATERKLWVGPSDAYADLGSGPMLMERAHLGEDEVRQVRDAMTEWLAQGDWTNDGIDAAVERIREREGDYLADLEWLAGIAYSCLAQHTEAAS